MNVEKGNELPASSVSYCCHGCIEVKPEDHSKEDSSSPFALNCHECYYIKINQIQSKRFIYVSQKDVGHQLHQCTASKVNIFRNVAHSFDDEHETASIRKTICDMRSVVIGTTLIKETNPEITNTVGCEYSIKSNAMTNPDNKTKIIDMIPIVKDYPRIMN